ncbi:DUF3159 domain-containing protein [Nonomuraea sp. CA-143628]|uniref:DUF3159 domain-containing protein n=1 Tax=Nonomuraea sp. CA-143628 TaxID=3239997 RepID=UPI003D8BA6B0
MTETGTDKAHNPFPGPPRRAADVVRHIVDALAAPAAFLMVESGNGAAWGAIVALVVALAVGAIRRYRGDSPAVVMLSTSIVALHSVSAIASGEGRAFYFPELVINVAGLVACAVSLLIGRPLTEAVCRKAGIEPSRTAGDPAVRRRHVRLTAGWVVLWVSHLVPLGYLYAANSLVGLTLVSALFSKPSLLAMAGFTVVVVRRAVRRDLYATGAALDHDVVTVTPEGRPAPCGKDPS